MVKFAFRLVPLLFIAVFTACSVTIAAAQDDMDSPPRQSRRNPGKLRRAGYQAPVEELPAADDAAPRDRAPLESPRRAGPTPEARNSVGHGAPEKDWEVETYAPGSWDDGDDEYGDADDCDERCDFRLFPRLSHGPIYFRSDVLLWWSKGSRLPPLVTTSTAGTAQAQAGVFGQPNTLILFGNGTVNNTIRSGGRVTFGYWLDPCLSVEANYFGLGREFTEFTATSANVPILARPFFNLNPNSTNVNQQDANLIAFPGLSSGAVRARIASHVEGAGFDVRKNLCCDDTCGDTCGDRHYRLDGLVGYRFLDTAESLTVEQRSTALAGAAAPGTTLAAFDSFRTRSQFHGTEFGFDSQSRFCRLSFDVVGKLALGTNVNDIAIRGGTLLTPAGGAATTSAGGLLTQRSNIGDFHRDPFAVVPELEVRLGYDTDRCWRFLFGYNFIYWNRVARAANQVDLGVNTSQASGQPLVGAARPAVLFKQSDFWLQGLSFGAEARF